MPPGDGGRHALAADGVPFREAHEIIGRLVRGCIAKGIGLEDLTLPDLHEYDPRFTPAALTAITPEASAHARTSQGGTSPKAVEAQLAQARARAGR